jgi:ubiquinone/menaquinone biosynthesis C-methylase UbiE
MASLTRFDELASGYEGWFATRLGAFVDRREKELMLGLLNPQPDETILEIGSGTGYFLRSVAESGARCIGIEPSEEMLSVAIARPAGNVEYVRGCGESLPFSEGSLDAVLYMTTLEFVSDVEAALKEAGRIVRRDGRLVFGILSAEGPWARARKRAGGLWAGARFFNASELEAMLSPLGAVQIEYCVHVPPRLGWLPAPLMSLVDGAFRRLFPASGALIAARVIPRRAQ